MKIVKILLVVSALMVLMGCAQRPAKYPKYNYMNKLENQAKIVGSHKVEIVGPITWSAEGVCSVVDFVSAATTQTPNVHDVINIRADETKTARAAGAFDYSCKYWGIAVRYVPVNDSTPATNVKGKLTFTVNEAEVETSADATTTTEE